MRISFILGLLVVVLALELVVVMYRREPAPLKTEPIVREPISAARPTLRYAMRGAAEGATLPELEPATNHVATTNLYERWSEETPHLTLEQLEPFLAKHHRNVDALLGALRASGDDTLLKEAQERFPNDPRVQFASAYKAVSAEERQQWLEKFKASAPDNSLANYLLAGEQLKSGKAEEALQELTAAAGKKGFSDYLVDFMQNTEEAYRAGGYSDAEAKAISGSSALLPELAKLKGVGVDLVELAKRYQQAGDESSAQAVLQMGMNLGKRLEDSSQITLIQNLVGMAVERLALNAMNPAAPYGDTGQTVQDQIDALTARKKSYRELTAASQPILRSLSDSDVAQFHDRLKIYGEVAAMRWVVGQAPQK